MLGKYIRTIYYTHKLKRELKENEESLYSALGEKVDVVSDVMEKTLMEVAQTLAKAIAHRWPKESIEKLMASNGNKEFVNYFVSAYLKYEISPLYRHIKEYTKEFASRIPPEFA